MSTETLETVFDGLRTTMLASSNGMSVFQDEPGNLVVKTSWDEPGKNEPAWFGAVQLKKNYVSYHLMPLYGLPDLREDVPEALRRRMQGKSCFNFKKLEPDLISLLQVLTEQCASAYSQSVASKPH